jgi:prepilin-type N-terminal cleavage/methylation domain-containing protein
MKKAFTLIELIISIGIIVVFSGLALPRYNNYNNELKLKKEVKRLVSVIELAKKKALTSDLYDSGCNEFEGYRVVVGTYSFGLNFLCAGMGQEIQEYLLDSNVIITAGTGNLDFPPIGANVNIPIGTIRFRSDSIDKCIDVTITSIGIVSTDESLFGC